MNPTIPASLYTSGWRFHLRLATWLPLVPLLLAQGAYLTLKTAQLPVARGPQSFHFEGHPPEIRLLVLGESTSAGVGVTATHEALPAQIAQALAQQSQRAVSMQAIGENGAIVAELTQVALKRLPEQKPDLLVIVMGVNDTTHMRSPGQWGRDLHIMIVMLREKLGPLPVLLTPMPPINDMPFLPRPLRAFLGMRAAALEAMTQQVAARLPDVHISLLQFDASPEDFAGDGFHPNALGYARWGAALAQSAREILNL